jgi:hypothetical protein
MKNLHMPSSLTVTLRGRVFGVTTAGGMLSMPLSTLAAVFLTDQFGLMPMLIGIGDVFLATTLSMHAIPAMRHMDRKY